MSEKLSARINEGMRVLKDEYERAVYLLNLEGVRYGEEIEGEGGDAGGVKSEAAKAEPELLMMIMEVREEIEDIAEEVKKRQRKLLQQHQRNSIASSSSAASVSSSSTSSSSSNPLSPELESRLREIKSSNDSRLRSCVRDLSRLFAAQDWAGVKSVTGKLSYFSNIEHELKKLLPVQ